MIDEIRKLMPGYKIEKLSDTLYQSSRANSDGQVINIPFFVTGKDYKSAVDKLKEAWKDCV